MYIVKNTFMTNVSLIRSSTSDVANCWSLCQYESRLFARNSRRKIYQRQLKSNECKHMRYASIENERTQETSVKQKETFLPR